MALSRRTFLKGMAAASATGVVACAEGGTPTGDHVALGFGDGKTDGFSNATFLESLDICELGFATELVDDAKPHVKQSRGHNTRLYTRLPDLVPDGEFSLRGYTSDRLVVPQSSYYIRTEAPDQMHLATDADIPNFEALDTPQSAYLETLRDHWQVAITGLVSHDAAFKPGWLTGEVSELGATMMECAGNDKYSNFRLMSAAHWRGIRVDDFWQLMQSDSGFGLTEIRPEATHVKISGFDLTEETKWNRFLAVESQPGASWIFSLEELREQGAFFATGMQGQDLTLDHGFPLRLVVPRYYGCTCIKWVNRLEFMTVDGNTETTGQMREFADRTHQAIDDPRLYKQHLRPLVDQSLTPIKVEKWVVDGRLAYRVVGLMWGGSELEPDLSLSLYRDGFFKNGPDITLSVDHVVGSHSDAFSLWWSEFWQPPRKGKYVLQPRIHDPHVQARRVRDGYYDRGVRIRQRS